MDEDFSEPGDALAMASVMPIRDVLGRPAAPPPSSSRHLLTRIDTVIALVMALAAGVVAALAPGAPTGIGGVDDVLKFALAAACVLAARRTPWPFVGAAAIVCAVSSYKSAGALICTIVLAVAVVGWRTYPDTPESEAEDRPPPAVVSPWSVVARSACNGALACLAMRAGWPHISLVPSALAALVVLLLILPAVLLASLRVRRIVWRVAALFVLAGLILTAIAGVAVEEAKQPLQIGLAAARSGLHAAEHGDQATTTADFKRAASAFSAANSDLDWARAAELVPIVSQQVRAVGVAASIGGSLSNAGVSTAASANEGDLKVVHGVFPVAKLASLVPIFKQDLATLDSVLGHDGPLSSPWVLGLLKSRFESEKSRIKRAQHDATVGLLAAEVIPGFLGADGPKTDLVLVENPAESRASGGVVGDYAEVSADGGKLHLVHVGSSAQLNSQGVPPLKRRLPDIPDFIDRYDVFYPQDHWENVPMSPDFPTVGKVASFLFPQSGGTTVTGGVISIDPVAISCLLKLAGGSIPWPGHNAITTHNVVPFLEHYEFIDFDHNDAGRIKFVEGLLKRVWSKLLSTSLPAPDKIAKDMQPAIRGGHLLMYSSNPALESFFQDIHVAGGMPAVHGDFLGVVTQNAAGNKIDWYLHRRISYDAHLDLATDTISSTVTITLGNSAPSSGQPAFVINGVKGTGTTPGESLLWLSVYSPWPLVSATVDGKPVQFDSQLELSRNVYSELVKIPPGGTTQVVVHLSGPWKGPGHYELGMYKQPTVNPDVVSTKVSVTK